MKDKKLIFMATPFRSGSAMTSRMLNAHSQVAMVCDKLKYFTFCYDRYSPLTDDNIKKLLNDVAARLNGRYDITINVDECFDHILSKPRSEASIKLLT